MRAWSISKRKIHNDRGDVAQPGCSASIAMASRRCAECMADIIGETSTCRRCERPLDSPPPRRKRLAPGFILGSIAFGTVLAVVASLLIHLRG